MLARINICASETKPYSQGLIFVVTLGLVKYLSTHELYLQVFIFGI